MHGSVAPGYDGVAAAFRRTLGAHGGAFAAVVGGELVADLWGGVADPRTGAVWERDTLSWIYSGTKGLTATCMLVLLERGQLDLDAPVAGYWPGFTARNVLVRHVLAHQAGLPGLTTPVTSAEATDGDRMASLLARQRPVTPPGTALCYHALTFGWLCGELIRRVDGRPAGRFFAEEIAGPLGLDAHLGLPAALEPRVAWLEREPGFAAPAAAPGDAVAWSIWANPPRFEGVELPANQRDWHACGNPASGAIVTARAVARLYGCLACGGAPVLAAATIAAARRTLAAGDDPYLGPSAYGTGFQLQTGERRLGPPASAFGHGGSGGSMHGAWPDQRTGFSYVTNLLRSTPGPDPRPAAILAALAAAVAHDPRSSTRWSASASASSAAG